ncbi:MAG: epoxyqueuosine reductase QueH [Oscillospiraceae bacterium]|nr:epoxyqueuosine reductase QueH [Oscillospiraceae bacterium]
MQKQNYHQEMQQKMAAIPAGQRLLLHSCCGPCSAAVMERLGAWFVLEVYFYNPNIQDKAEYQQRLEAQRVAIKRVDTAYPVTLIEAPYNPAPFEDIAVGLEDTPEGGPRCTACFTLRLTATAQLANERGIPYFTTTLTVSPRKDAVRLNEIGHAVGEPLGTTYLPGDLKKQGGYQRSMELAQAWGLYRQSYCGCLFH